MYLIKSKIITISPNQVENVRSVILQIKCGQKAIRANASETLNCDSARLKIGVVHPNWAIYNMNQRSICKTTLT